MMAKNNPPITRVSFDGAPQDANKAVSGNSAEARYESLQAERNPFLLRAIDCAKITIPYLFPPLGHNASTILPTPYQGTGARGVNNLASKMVLALMPPNSAFFKYEVDEFTAQKMGQDPNLKTLIDKSLSAVERAVMTKIDSDALRVQAFESMKQLIVAGNSLFYLKPEGGAKTFRLDRYVVRRDTMGKLLEIIVREDVKRKSLDFDQMFVFQGGPGATDPEASAHEGDVTIYTWVRRDEKDAWKVHQEINGKVVPGSDGSYPKDKSPWLVLRWTCVDNEDYGRGYVEEYLGDIKSLESLTRAIVEAAAAAAKVLFLVNPNGSTNAKQLAEAPNGAIRSGNAEDVTTLQMEKAADFQIANEVKNEITQRLSFAFLMNTAIQRQGERVTAEEIRYMAGELEDALGGIYSVLTQEFQLPLVNALVAQMERHGDLPKLPHDLLHPTITTGIDAIGRGQDVNKLQQFMQILNTMGPQVSQTIAQMINVDNLVDRVATSLSIDTDGLLKSPEQVQQEQQAAQQQQFAQNVAPNVVKGISDNLKQHQANQAQQGAQPNG